MYVIHLRNQNAQNQLLSYLPDILSSVYIRIKPYLMSYEKESTYLVPIL